MVYRAQRLSLRPAILNFVINLNEIYFSSTDKKSINLDTGVLPIRRVAFI